MSLLLNHSLSEASAVFRGERQSPAWPPRIPSIPLSVWRLRGITAAPGHEPQDSDEAWDSVVRSWWGQGITWGLCVVNGTEGVQWSLVVPRLGDDVIAAVNANLTGARLEQGGDFDTYFRQYGNWRQRMAFGGHPGVGFHARLEPILRGLQGRSFLALILSISQGRSALENEILRIAGEAQFTRDEYLARAGLERDNHAGASDYLGLVAAARERAVASLTEGGWLTRLLLIAPEADTCRQAAALLHGAYSSDGGRPEPFRSQEADDPRSLTFLRSTELAALTRPPRRDLPGFTVEADGVGNPAGPFVTRALFGTDPCNPVADRVLALGRVVNDDRSARGWLETDADDLTRHLLVAGMTGSGKSVTCEHLLLELWRSHRIPWMVIEPGMKPAYRRLLHSEIGGDIAVWAMGVPGARKLSLNPLAMPPGVGVAEHAGALFAVISSAFELVAPMPEVLAEAIDTTYRNHGWDTAGIAPNTPPPTLRNLIDTLDRLVGTLGYGPEITGNIRAGLLVRMRRILSGPVAAELGTPHGMDIARMIGQPVVIELSALPDANTQALVAGLIALQLRHHWRLCGPASSLRHVLLLEEAHRLLKAVPETAANSARVRATEDLAHMLAELRGFGAGMIVVDQTPSALVPSVIANTGTKILHRLDHPADRELAGRSAGLPADQVDLLGSLGVGEAILRTDSRPRPYRLRIPNPAVTYGHLPLPALPPTPNAPCSVCASANCDAAIEGREPAKLAARIAAFQRACQNGMGAARQWAERELSSAVIAASQTNCLCFLVSLGKAAGLSEVTLTRIRTAFGTDRPTA